MLARFTVAATSAALIAGGVGVMASPAGAATPSTTAATGCATGQLPPSILGNPNVKPGQTGGAYIGHGTGPNGERVGYGFAVTHPGSKPVVFTGTITASAPISAAKVRVERHDVIRLSADKHTLTFRFVNYGAIDGVAFRADCAKTVTFKLFADGHQLVTDRVFLGANRVHPTSNPFTIERT